MKTKLFVAMLLAGSSMFAATHVSIGIGVGGYGNGYRAAPPPPVVAYAPPRPGPGYTWVDGYWDQVGPRRSWRSGYWAVPSYRGGYRVEGLNENNRHESDVRNRNGNYIGDRYGNSYSAKDDKNRYAGNRNNGNLTSGREGTDSNRYNNGYNGNHTANLNDQNRSGSNNNQYNNGSGRR
jgi:hypothetical protein